MLNITSISLFIELENYSDTITIPEHIFVLASKSHSFNHRVCRQAKKHGAFYIIIQQATQFLQHQTYITSFYILLTVHHVMILGKWPTWCTILFFVFIYIFNSLHVLNTSCSSSGETNCVNTTSGSCHAVSLLTCTRHSHRHRVTAAIGCIDTICVSWWWARCAQNM